MATRFIQSGKRFGDTFTMWTWAKTMTEEEKAERKERIAFLIASNPRPDVELEWEPRERRHLGFGEGEWDDLVREEVFSAKWMV